MQGGRLTDGECPSGSAADLSLALRCAVELPDPAVGRLRHSHTSVRFAVGDDHVTLLLDRSPPTVGHADEPAEIDIALTEEQAAEFAAGRFPLGAALICGSVASRGPVRRYLEVDPILRRLLAGGTPARTEDRLAAHPGEHARHTEPIPADRLAIETRNLQKSFGSFQVLKKCDLRIPEGVISVILGPSGTGKSVLLQHIIGLMTPDSGEVLIRGTKLSAMSRSEVLGLRREIGVMFQDGALFSNMNVYDNVAFPLRQHTNLPEGSIHRVVNARLSDVGLLDAGSRMPGQLSGGMRKRAGLARSLVLEPSIILCDEPDSGLDPVRTSLLGDLLVEQHAAHGGTMVVVTHNVPLARQIGDHMSVLWQGNVLESGLAGDVLASESEFVQQFLASATVGPLTMDA